MTDTLERREAIARAVKDILRGPDGEEYTDAGMEDAFFRWPVIERAILALSLPAREVHGERAREVLAQTMEEFGGDAKWSCAQDIRNDVGGEYWDVPLRAMTRFATEALATTPAPREKLEAALESIARPFPDGCNWEDQARACQIVALAALNRLSGEG